MLAPRRIVLISLLSQLIMLFPFALCSEGSGPPQPNAKKAPSTAKPAPKPNYQKANSDGSFAESEMLRQAFVLLLNGNGDYNGHRVNAMGAVREGFKALDAHVAKHGTPAQKAQIQKDRIAVRNAEVARNLAGVIRQGQGTSDAELRQAAALLTQIRGSLSQDAHRFVLNHVNNAIAEIGIALSIR
jgi:hypothetical protein